MTIVRSTYTWVVTSYKGMLFPCLYGSHYACWSLTLHKCNGATYMLESRKKCRFYVMLQPSLHETVYSIILLISTQPCGRYDLTSAKWHHKCWKTMYDVTVLQLLSAHGAMFNCWMVRIITFLFYDKCNHVLNKTNGHVFMKIFISSILPL